MKKVLLLALSALAAALVIPAAFAGNGPAPKATGDISYANPWTGDATDIYVREADGVWRLASWHFNAFEEKS